jgi:hypothetical protein
MAKTVDQQNEETAQARQDKVDEIQNQRESGRLAELLINDRKNRGVLNKTAGDFATVNDNINILANQMKQGDGIQTTDAQKIRAFNVKRDKTIRDAKGLDEGANIKDEIKEDNTRLEKTAKEKGITLNELKVALQDKRDAATQEALLDVTKELLSVTEQAETASVRDQKKLLRQTNTQIKILMEVEGQNDPETSPVLKQALETQKMLKANTTILKQTGEVLVDQMVSGLGALVGVLGDSPALALGAQFIQTKFNERKENKKAEVAKVRSAVREKSDREITGLAEIQGMDAVEKDDTPKESPKVAPAPRVKVMPKVASTDDLEESNEENSDGVITAVRRVEDKLEEGNVQAQARFAQQRRDAIEARRDAKGSTFGKKKKGEEIPEEKDGMFGNLLSAVLAGDFITWIAGKLKSAAKWVLTTIFSKKALMFILKKALPIAAIGAMLFSGFKAGIDSFKENGDITQAIGDGAAGIASAITFGFVSADQFKNWGSDLGMWIEDGIAGWAKEIESALEVPIDTLKQFGRDLKEWFSPLTNMVASDILPDWAINVAEKAGIKFDTREDRIRQKRVEEYDRQAEDDLRARVKTSMSGEYNDDTIEALRTSIEAGLQAKADLQGKTLDELKAALMVERENAPIEVVPPKAEVIPISTARVAETTDKASTKLEAKVASKQVASLEKVETEKRVQEKRKAYEYEQQKRKAQQPTVVNRTSNTQKITGVNVQAGGPSDNDHMYNRAENAARSGW